MSNVIRALSHALGVSRSAHADIVFSTTFNCADSTQSNGVADADIRIPGNGIAGADKWAWEIAVKSADFGNAASAKGRWYTQAFLAWRHASGKKHREFY